MGAGEKERTLCVSVCVVEEVVRRGRPNSRRRVEGLFHFFGKNKNKKKEKKEKAKKKRGGTRGGHPSSRAAVAEEERLFFFHFRRGKAKAVKDAENVSRPPTQYRFGRTHTLAPTVVWCFS